MTDRILFVDDEVNILNGLRRTLRRDYQFDTAVGGHEGLALIDEHPYAVVVSDMRMPEMGGEEFLAKAHERQPDTVQMILSGQADLDSTVQAVNNANIFRFLVKPVDRVALGSALDLALRQFRLIHAERDLLENTLSGAVSALTEVVALVSPAASRRTRHVVSVAEHLGRHVDMADDWQLRLAAMLSGIGYAAIPTEVLDRAATDDELTGSERAMLDRHPDVTAQLLGPIPRLEGVTNLIRAQAGAEALDPDLQPQFEVLDLAVTVARGLSQGRDIGMIVHDLPPDRYRPDLVDCLGTMADDRQTVIEDCQAGRLTAGMILRQDILTTTGVPPGQHRDGADRVATGAHPQLPRLDRNPGTDHRSHQAPELNGVHSQLDECNRRGGPAVQQERHRVRLIVVQDDRDREDRSIRHRLLHVAAQLFEIGGLGQAPDVVRAVDHQVLGHR